MEYLKLIDLLSLAFCAFLFSRCTSVFVEKWKIKEWFDLNKPKFSGYWCEVCFFFWSSLFFCFLVCIIAPYSFSYAIFSPFLAVGISRIIDN